MISIIIATFNSEATLERCLNSVTNQKNADYEIIIKDGASTDKTVNIIQRYSSQIKYWNTSKDQGVYDAWNHCLEFVSGDWFIFLGSDDYFVYDEFLSDIYEQLRGIPREHATIAFGRNLIVDEKGEQLGILGLEWNDAKLNIDSVMSIRHPGCFHSSRLLECVGKFNDKLRIAGDHHFILRSLRFGEPAYYEHIGVAHQLGGLSTNPKNHWTLIKETYLIRKDLGLTPAFKPDRLLLKRAILVIANLVLGKRLTAYVFSKVQFARKR